ncbi:hypothetical protein Ciccas_010599 [Cichlidogyrus casuarinus]|uniref:Uncharacterized protein n=1 Tax=Cichlidogyrus casuarinus TaxID=1844966 RepID=A0ABD2PTN0_9PLAT
MSISDIISTFLEPTNDDTVGSKKLPVKKKKSLPPAVEVTLCQSEKGSNFIELLVIRGMNLPESELYLVPQTLVKVDLLLKKKLKKSVESEQPITGFNAKFNFSVSYCRYSEVASLLPGRV